MVNTYWICSDENLFARTIGPTIFPEGLKVFRVATGTKKILRPDFCRACVSPEFFSNFFRIFLKMFSGFFSKCFHRKLKKKWWDDILSSHSDRTGRRFFLKDR